MALGAGLHEKSGIDLRVTVMDSGNAALAAVLGGSVAPAGPGEVLAAKMHGRDIVVVVNFYRGLLASLMLTKAAVAMASRGSSACRCHVVLLGEFRQDRRSQWRRTPAMAEIQAGWRRASDGTWQGHRRPPRSAP